MNDNVMITESLMSPLFDHFIIDAVKTRTRLKF